MTSRRGMALLIVVALLGVLAMAAGMTALATRVSAASAFASLERVELRTAIETAVARTAVKLADEEARWIADGRLYETEAGDVHLRIRAVAEPARFDLNSGNVETLAALLEALNVPPLAARRIAGAVSDWRDGDDVSGDNGAEAAAYRAANRPSPGNRPFIAVEEFRQVLGVDAAIYAAAEPYLTLHGTEAVAGRYAPPRLIRAAGVSAGDARRILAARNNNSDLPETTDSAQFDPAQPAAYAIFVEAEAGSGARLLREIIISLPGSEGLYDTLSRHSHVFGYADFLEPEPEP
ncbi:type II secretion system minor pseudopilin [Hyphobacterium indicum]|uniref:general secretion pathway protein GspK n=1 Tax=Hyphobacterium indicum TaxID=2162714 RepID=UPI000D65BB4B|nr:type II secretion system protein GspK [Hyphobacterium indicum]